MSGYCSRRMFSRLLDHVSQFMSEQPATLRRIEIEASRAEYDVVSRGISGREMRDPVQCACPMPGGIAPPLQRPTDS